MTKQEYKSQAIERLRNRSARQACKDDLADIYEALTGCAPSRGTSSGCDLLRRAIASKLGADLLANSDPPPRIDLTETWDALEDQVADLAAQEAQDPPQS